MHALILALVLANDGGYRSSPYEEDVELQVVEGPPIAPYENADAGLYEVASATRYDGGQLPDGWWLSPLRLDTVAADLRGCERDLWMAREAEAQRREQGAAPQPTISLFQWGFWPGVAIGLGFGVAAGAGTVLLLGR